MRKASEIAAFDEKKRLFYDQEIMTERDYKPDFYWSRREGLEEGLAKGMQGGLEKGLQDGLAKAKEEKLRIAKNFLAMRLTTEQVASATGLTVEELESLK